MLTAATLGLLGYGLYSIGVGLVDLLGAFRLELWAHLLLLLLGAQAALAAALVRVRFPGAIALAMAAVLGLQALALHNATHFWGRIYPALELGRGAFAAGLVLLAHLGSRAEARRGVEAPYAAGER